jgi:hypothetical protein
MQNLASICLISNSYSHLYVSLLLMGENRQLLSSTFSDHCISFRRYFLRLSCDIAEFSSLGVEPWGMYVLGGKEGRGCVLPYFAK